MPDPIGPAIFDALASQLRAALAGAPVLDDVALQVEPRLVWRPSPPTIDLYPASPYQNAIAFGAGALENELRITVRARVGTPDHDAAQELLLELADPVGSLSVALAIEADDTLGGSCSQAVVTEGPTEFGVFPATDGAGDLLGCTWTVVVTP